MSGISPPAVDWLLSHVDPAHWCEFYFPRRRYGHLTSNIAESLNAWLLEAREKPVLAMFEQMHHQSMQWFDKRRYIDTNMEGLLVSTAAKAIQSTLNPHARAGLEIGQIGVGNDPDPDPNRQVVGKGRSEQGPCSVNVIPRYRTGTDLIGLIPNRSVGQDR